MTRVEEFGGLASHTCHHIDADKGMWHELLDEFDLVSEKSCVVTAVHQAKHFVASCLKGNVKVWRKAARCSHPSNHFVGQKVGLDARYAVSFDPLHFVKGSNQVKESFSIAFAKVSDVDTGQHDFATSVGGDFVCHFDERFDGGIATASACHRDGAICAEVVTSVLDFQKMTSAVVVRARVVERTYFLVSTHTNVVVSIIFISYRAGFYLSANELWQ